MNQLGGFALLAGGLLFSLVLLELALRALTPFPVDEEGANQVEDPKLLYRMDPSLPDIDAAGFRNPVALDSAGIVALGDSHTYGWNVASRDSWPQRLGEMLGTSVYNFGIGGYGVLNYYALFDRALALRPDHVIVGLYLANDLAGMCVKLDLPYWRDRIRSDPRAGDILGSCQRMGIPTSTLQGAPLGGPSRWATRTATGSALRHLVWNPLKTELELRGVLGGEGRYIRVTESENRLLIGRGRVVTHAAYMDPDSENVATLARYAKALLLEMSDLAKRRDTHFGILVIPSRERVLYRYLLDSGYTLPSDFHELFEAESELTSDFLDFFDRHGIDAMDALAELERAVRDSGSVYPRREDGHPLADGYHAYARAAYTGLILPAQQR